MHAKSHRWSVTTFCTAFTLLFLLCLFEASLANDERISYNIYVVGEDRSFNEQHLTRAGHNVTWDTDVSKITLANLSPFDQVWFVDIINVPDLTGRANLINFIKAGGKVFFGGDSYKSYRATLFDWRDSLFNEIGAGGIKQSELINPSQTAYYTNPFHVTSYSPNAVHYIDHGPGRNGSFENIGNGTVIVGAGLNATGDAIAIAFDYGTLTNAKNSRAIVYLNSNNTTNWPAYVENLAKFLGPKDKSVFSVKTTKALPGNTGRLKFTLHNTNDVSGIQFQVQAIPDLISPVQFLTSYRTSNFSISYEEFDSGLIKVVLSSEQGGKILQGTGDVAELVYTVHPDVQVGDSADILLSEVIISDQFELLLPTSVFGGKFYCEVLKGDVVMDGVINIADLVRIINIILDRPPEPNQYELEAADYNSDGQINILDIVAIVNVILGREPAGTLAKSDWSRLVDHQDEFLVKEMVLNLPLPIQCDSPLRGLQLQLCYDTKLIDIGAPKLTDRTKNMSLDFQKSEGSIDVLLFNFDKDFIAAGSGPVITVPVVIKSQSFESSMIKIENVILAGVNCQPVAATGIEDISVSINDLSMDYSLAQNYPNPFNAETEIQYYIPITAKVNLTIYNLLGEEIITLVDQKLQAGSHRVHWDGRDKKGFNLPTGIYLYRIQSENYTKTRKLALMK